MAAMTVAEREHERERQAPGARTIRAIRRALNWSVYEMADWFGVRDYSVRRWEMGKRPMSWYHQQQLARLVLQPEVQAKLRAAGLAELEL